MVKVCEVQWRRSLLSTHRCRMVCGYDAADAETVCKVQPEAQDGFDRIGVAVNMNKEVAV